MKVKLGRKNEYLPCEATTRRPPDLDSFTATINATFPTMSALSEFYSTVRPSCDGLQ